MAGVLSRGSFRFLFRQDAGVITRAVWWTGTLALSLTFAALTLVWLAIAGGAHRSLDSTPLFDVRTAFTYLYLVIYAVAALLISVSQYYLSAKRFRACGKPPECAGILPFSALFNSVAHWVEPRVGDSIPAWVVPALDVLMLAVIIWNILELGVRKNAASVKDA